MAHHLHRYRETSAAHMPGCSVCVHWGYPLRWRVLSESTWLLAGILRVCGLKLATACLALLVLLLFGTDTLHPASSKEL